MLASRFVLCACIGFSFSFGLWFRGFVCFLWLTVLCSVIFRVLVGFTGLECLDLMLVDGG